MKAQEIINYASKRYEMLRRTEQTPTQSENMLFEACATLKRLKAPNLSNNGMSDLTQAICGTLFLHLERLTWKCGECDKADECEEQPTTNQDCETDCEPRYCLSLIQAALREDYNFEKPFTA